MHAREGAVERRLVEAVALDDFGVRGDRSSRARISREAPHRAAALFESSKKTAADVSRCAGEQDRCVCTPIVLRHHDRVDDVNDAVARGDVGLDDVRLSAITSPSRTAMVSESPLTAFADFIFMTSAAITFPATT